MKTAINLTPFGGKNRNLDANKGDFTQIYLCFVAVLYINLGASVQKFAHDLLIAKRVLYAFDLLICLVALA